MIDIKLEIVNCLCGENVPLPFIIIHLNDGREAKIVECRKCGLRYMSPRPDHEFLDWMYKDEYYASVINDRDEWEKKTHEYEIKRENVHRYRLKPIIKMRGFYGFKNLLDIGTGPGYFLKLAKEKGFDVMGIEISERASEFARKNYGVNVLNISRIEEAGLKDNSFDVVSLCHVIEHLPYPEDTLKEIHRILTDNGLLLIVTPNNKTFTAFLSCMNRKLDCPVRPLEDEYVNKIWENGKYHFRPKRLDEEGYIMYLLHNLDHLYFFDPKTLKEMLLRRGFSIEAYPSGGYDYWTRGIRRLFSNRPVNMIARIFNLQKELMFYARKT